MTVWSAYRDDDPDEPAETDVGARPDQAPRPEPGTDPVEFLVDGARFVVTRRMGSPGTYDFDWTSHPASYGFTVGMNGSWTPDREELAEHIRSFLAEVDPETGYLPD